MKLRFPIAVSICLIFICFSYTSSINKKRPHKDGRCATKACEAAATDLRRCMDTEVNPCDDFYKFTCGNFLKKAKIPDDKESISALTEIQNKLDKKLRAIFEKKKCDNCPPYEKYLRGYYNSCMDLDVIDRDGASEMLDLFREFGGWPLVDDSWEESKADLTKIITTMLKYQLMGLFSFFAYNDEKNSSARIIIMYQQSLMFPIDYYTDKKQKDKLDAYKTLIINVAKRLSGNNAKNDKEKEVSEMFTFEKNLSKIVFPPNKLRHQNQQKITLGSLAEKFDKVIDMSFIAKTLFEGLNITIDMQESIGIYGMDYFDKLVILLKKTPKRIVVNYLTWQMFIRLFIALPKEYEDFLIEFEKITSGVSKMEPRWKRCTSLVARELYKPLGAIYAKTYFNETAKEKVKKIIKNLKKTFKDMILNVAWLRNSTKSSALKKLNSMREHIGYPDYYDDEKNLFENMFDKIKGDDFESKCFLRKHLDFLSLVNNENLKLLRKKVEPHKPEMEVAVINAFYNTPTNEIVFPAGILQLPLFSEAIPMYLNYGGIGYVIGHEITHGFDDDGHRYDSNGNLHNWWGKTDRKKFTEASKCVAELYSTFVVEELKEKVNGNLTLGENIADNGGLRAAFMAYKSWVQKNGDELKLPDLEYTPEQLFFINFGRTLCEKTRLEVSALSLRMNYHSPNQFRIIGPIMNMEEFSDVFKCQANSSMNPEKKCRVW